MAQALRKDEDEAESPTRRPVDTARHGNVEIAIWRNEGAQRGVLLCLVSDDSL